MNPFLSAGPLSPFESVTLTSPLTVPRTDVIHDDSSPAANKCAHFSDVTYLGVRVEEERRMFCVHQSVCMYYAVLEVGLDCREELFELEVNMCE